MSLCVKSLYFLRARNHLIQPGEHLSSQKFNMNQILYLIILPYPYFTNCPHNDLYSSFFKNYDLGYNSRSLFAFSGHMTLFSFNLKQFLSLSSSFITMTFLRERPVVWQNPTSIWVRVTFARVQIWRTQWHPTLAWEIPWMEEPGRLQSMGSLKVGHD